jgi:hypothetical protein
MAVSKSEYMATTVLQEAKPLMQVIYSNVKEVVEQGQYIFDTLWNAAIPAEQRIKEIEEGVETEFTKVITDGNKVAELIVELAKSVKREAYLLLPDSNVIIMVEELGIWDYLIQAAKEKGADVRVLCYMSGSNENAGDIVRRFCSFLLTIACDSHPHHSEQTRALAKMM